MNDRQYLFTSESVSEGHPDKLADRFSDAILDLFLAADPAARVACETFLADTLVVVAGEFHTNPPELIPLPLLLAHRLVQRQAELRRSGAIPWLRPDAKSQVTVRYRDDGPVGVETVVLSTQHADGVDEKTIGREVKEQIVNAVIPVELRTPAFSWEKTDRVESLRDVVGCSEPGPEVTSWA